MKKIREKLKNIWALFKKGIEKFPVTIFTIFIITVIFAINLDNNFLSGIVMSNIASFGAIFSITTFLIETLDIKALNKKIIFYILAGIISGVSVYALNEINSDIVTRIVVCYCLSIFISAIYFNYRKSNKPFNEYLTQVFINILKAGVVYGVLAIGFAIISSIFIILILNNKGYMLVLRIEILLLGIYYIPAIIYSFHNVDNEIGKFSKVLIKYILNSLVILAFAIIYIYIAKIIILRVMPSNQIFRILATLFILGCPIWIMASSFKEDDFVSKINKYLPMLFIPFIILQIYSIGVRIVNNGVTEARYLCIMLIIFEIIYTIIYLINKEKIGNILVAMVAIIIVSTVVPYINMYKVSELSQYHNLKIYKQKTEYTEKEKDKIYGAYVYLKGTDYVKDYLTRDDIEKITSFKETDRDARMEYINASTDIDNIKIQGYNELFFISANHYNTDYDNDKSIEDAFKKVEFETDSGDRFYFNLTDEIENYIDNGNNLDEYLNEHYEIDIDENKKMLIQYISISYDEVSQTVKSYTISAYLLER